MNNRDTGIYWNIQKLLTYNAFMNIIIGERGVGKSYQCKSYAVRKGLKGKKFMYVRRYETELDLMLKDNKNDEESFFKDISKDPEFAEIEFKIENNTAYANGKVIGYFMALSRQSHYKSIPFPDIVTIMFDEVFIQNNRYLKNEVTQFLELIETIGRLRNNLKVFLLSNFISLVNPYFLAFDLRLPYGSDIKTFKEGTILVCYIKNEKYREVKRETKFGKMIKGTQFEKYAIDNEALVDTKEFIKKKNRGSRHLFNIIINNNKYGVWNDKDTTHLIVSKDFNTSSPILLTFDFNSHTEKTTLARTRSPYFKSLIEGYSRGILFFESIKIKEQVLGLIQKYLY